MAFTLSDAVVPVFRRGLQTLTHLLEKAEASGLDEAGLIAARLAPDMRPFPAQIQMACDSAKGAVARLAGVQAPSMADDERTFAELKDRVTRTLAFIESVDPQGFAEAEDRPVEVRTPRVALRFRGGGYLTSFAIPNFYFHVSMAYALLRNAGVALGKPDFLGQVDLSEPPVPL